MQFQANSPPWLNQQDIAQRSSPLTLEHPCSDPVQQCVDTPLLTGCFQVIALRTGLIVHTVDVHNLQNMVTQATLVPSLKLAIVVDGQADISFDQQRFVLGNSSTAQRNTASLISLTRPTRFERRGVALANEKTVSISFSRDWLLASWPNAPQQLLDFIEQHLSSHLWQPSKKALAIAQQIVATPSIDSGLHQLFLESRCIELISEALLSLLKQTQPYTTASTCIDQRLLQAKALLENPELTHLVPEQIAQQVGMSTSSLQRHFRRSFNLSLTQYHRQQRLRRALHALQKNQISISQAAELAGYSTTGNFSTAVKKEFGVTPTQLQNTF